MATHVAANVACGILLATFVILGFAGGSSGRYNGAVLAIAAAGLIACGLESLARTRLANVESRASARERLAAGSTTTWTTKERG